MLTATYSLVAIAAEQDKTRSILGRLQQYIQTTWKGLQGIDFTFLETAFNKLLQLENYFHTRKIELYLIPALRNASKEVDILLAELDTLSTNAEGFLRSVGDQLTATFDLGNIKINEICHAMEQYCDRLFIRLDKEEKELLPMARRLFSIEDWFSIAAQFLSDDAAAYERRRHPLSSSRTASQQPAPMINVR